MSRSGRPASPERLKINIHRQRGEDVEGSHKARLPAAYTTRARGGGRDESTARLRIPAASFVSNQMDCLIERRNNNSDVAAYLSADLEFPMLMAPRLRR